MITLATKTVREALDAMYYNFAPYLDQPIEKDWIVDLIDSYNHILNEMSLIERKMINEDLDSPHMSIYYEQS